MPLIEIITGGQTGVDRAALDFAIARAIPCGGWCPRDGWAEDYPKPPGLLARYPMLKSTPRADPAERTEWNIRDSDAALFVFDARGSRVSQGTNLAIKLAEQHQKPYALISLAEPAAVDAAVAWLQRVRPRRLGIGGPRESEAPGIYQATMAFLARVYDRLS
jgi:hypothetical protein